MLWGAWCAALSTDLKPINSRLLQRLKKLVGYLKGSPDFCVLLDVPVGGQGRWRSTDKHLILESFSDSDWSSNQVHRRSTSCGIHLLNGAFLFWVVQGHNAWSASPVVRASYMR